MGGVLLGLLVSVWWTFPAVRQTRLVLGLAFFVGHVNAALCRPLSLINPFNAIPRNFIMAWTSAIVAFALSVAISYTAINAIKRWRASDNVDSLPAPENPDV